MAWLLVWLQESVLIVFKSFYLYFLVLGKCLCYTSFVCSVLKRYATFSSAMALVNCAVVSHSTSRTILPWTVMPLEPSGFSVLGFMDQVEAMNKFLSFIERSLESQRKLWI